MGGSEFYKESLFSLLKAIPFTSSQLIRFAFTGHVFFSFLLYQFYPLFIRINLISQKCLNSCHLIIFYCINELMEFLANS